ncbi:hypothetical protein DFP73DRAFT_568942 [Morchella snyderi]|nr:hypothetical protein DFP73DRAFT_568942 [Morchella snyderi]
MISGSSPIPLLIIIIGSLHVPGLLHRCGQIFRFDDLFPSDLPPQSIPDSSYWIEIRRWRGPNSLRYTLPLSRISRLPPTPPPYMYFRPYLKTGQVYWAS